eukprot:6587043-Prorocentrum_lima.AAC.1
MKQSLERLPEVVQVSTGAASTIPLGKPSQELPRASGEVPPLIHREDMQERGGAASRIPLTLFMHPPEKIRD